MPTHETNPVSSNHGNGKRKSKEERLSINKNRATCEKHVIRIMQTILSMPLLVFFTICVVNVTNSAGITLVTSDGLPASDFPALYYLW